MAGEKRANEMAMELAALRRRRQDAEAEGKFGNEISEALQGVSASPLEARVDELYKQFQASKKPAKKKPPPATATATAHGADANESEAMRIARAHGFKGKYARFAPQAPFDPMESDMTAEDWQDQLALEQRAKTPHYLRQGEFRPVDRPIRRAMDVLPGTVRSEQAKAKAAPAAAPVEPPRRTPAAAASDLPPDQALADIARMTPAEAMAEWSLIASTSGVTGKKTPREATILAALKAKRDQFDESKVRQAPGGPYVPGFMRPK